MNGAAAPRAPIGTQYGGDSPRALIGTQSTGDSPRAPVAPTANGIGGDVTVVRAAGLTKRFRPMRGPRELLSRSPVRTVPAVHDVSLHVGAGEFVGLLGPNGAGKTTLLKMLATMIVPDAGTASISGYEIVRDVRDVRRLVAPVLANERSLYWRLSATENLELFAALAGVDRLATPQRVREVLEIVGLAETGRKMVGQFSAGMMQRLLVGRALLGRPRVLLLDEPTRSLDPSASHAFRRFLREEIGGRRQCAVLLATHRAEEAFDLCDRVIVMHRGRAIASGEPGALAHELIGARYSVWTMEPNHPVLDALVMAGRLRRLGARTDGSAPWWCVDVELIEGEESAPHVLSSLVAGGVAVARFERTAPTLGELIERSIARAGGGS